MAPRVVSSAGPVLLDDSGPAHVCIVLLSGIGDVVHGLPLAVDIKSIHPHSQVTWVAEPAPAEVLRHHPAVDRVVVFRPDQGLRGVATLRAALAAAPADVTLNVQRYFKSVWPTLFSGAPARVGLPISKTRDGVRFVHTHVLEDGPWKHVQELFLDFRWAIGADRDAEVRWDISFSEEEMEWRHDFFSEIAMQPVAALVVASANPEKDWFADRYAVLADRLAADFGMRVLLLGGPSDRERRITEDILRAAETSPTPALCRTVRELMSVVAGSSLVVAPDTGPVHIAHALGVPVIGLYGHTNPWRVGPWMHFHDLVVDRYTRPDTPPDPSGYLPRSNRMEAIGVEDVVDKVELAKTRYL